ncbi:MAG: TIM-barrel domain-containing protein [Ferruginibacter sp.]
MKKYLLLFNFLIVISFNALTAVPPSYILTNDGIIVYTDPAFTGIVKAIKIAAGFNFSMLRLPYRAMDIGGFVVPEKFEKPDAQGFEDWRALMTRWSQFGAFVPIFRSDGKFPYREVINTSQPKRQ